MTGLPTRKALRDQVAYLRQANSILLAELEDLKRSSDSLKLAKMLADEKINAEHWRCVAVFRERELERARLRELRHVNQIHKYQLTNQERRLRRLKAKQRELEEVVRSPRAVPKKAEWMTETDGLGYWVGHTPPITPSVTAVEIGGVVHTMPPGATMLDVNRKIGEIQSSQEEARKQDWLAANPDKEWPAPGSLTVKLPPDC